jgi:hypothetical protein
VIRFHPDAELELARLDVLTKSRLLTRLQAIEQHPELLGSLGVVGAPSRWAHVANCLVRFRRIEGTLLSAEPFILVTAVRPRTAETD